MKVKITDRQLQALNDLVQRDALGGSMLEFDEITDVKERLDGAVERRRRRERALVHHGFFLTKDFGWSAWWMNVCYAVGMLALVFLVTAFLAAFAVAIVSKVWH